MTEDRRSLDETINGVLARTVRRPSPEDLHARVMARLAARPSRRAVPWPAWPLAAAAVILAVVAVVPRTRHRNASPPPSPAAARGPATITATPMAVPAAATRPTATASPHDRPSSLRPAVRERPPIDLPPPTADDARLEVARLDTPPLDPIPPLLDPRQPIAPLRSEPMVVRPLSEGIADVPTQEDKP